MTNGILVIVVALIVAAGLFVWWKLTADKAVPPTPTPTPEPAPADPWREQSPAQFPVDSTDRDLRTATPNVVTVTWSAPLVSIKVGDTITAGVYLNGAPAPIATRCQWAMDHVGVVSMAQSTTTAGLNKLLALAPGTTRLIALVGSAMSPIMTATVSAVAPPPTPPPAPKPYPYPVPATHAPAMEWKRLRDWLTLVSTDFYYNWQAVTGAGPSAMETIYAKRYDVVYSGVTSRALRLKSVNPNFKHLPYSLQYTTLIDAPNSDPNDKPTLGTKYMTYFVQWCKDNSVDAASAEAAWLHDSNGNRVGTKIWNSPRDIIDPRNDVARRFTVWRYQEMAKDTTTDGFFIDEFGKGGMEPNWRLGIGTDAAALVAIEDAQVSLLVLISKALAALTPPKQLVINTAAYTFPFDMACVAAARGTHMEQTNNPLSGSLCGDYASTGGNPPPAWSFTDVALQHGAFVNMVPPYQFGEYESQVGGAGPTHMDTPRGKLAELVSYYMVVTDPALLGLSLENGDWAKYTPIQNYVFQCDADIGRAMETRWRATGSHVWQRRFTKGLVLFNPVLTWDRTKHDYGLATTVVLPTDRAYYRVLPDGTAAPTASGSISLRMCEAAIFVTR
ncbi:MAG: hypothetical protein ABI119_05910 [Gemmatimonadaceae bacterium]